MVDYSRFKCQFLKQEEIKAAATRFREKYWAEGTLPVDVERIIEERLGLDIIPVHNIRQLIRIDAYLRADLTGITVDYHQYMDDQNRYASRLRFSFAHEVGHYVLHNHIFKEFQFDTPDEYYQFVNEFPEKEYSWFEYQANEFAGSLLVPRERLKSELRKACSELKEKGLGYLLDEQPDLVLNTISPPLRKPFDVSDDVIVRRIEVEKLWPPK